MALSDFSNAQATQSNQQSLKRAQRALGCSPFYMKLFSEMRSQSVSLAAISDDRGIFNGYTRQPLSALAAENSLLWLIAVGILRREVDGQGLTDSFRITPLGRQLLDLWQVQGYPDWRGNFMDYLLDAGKRWLRLPSWLQ